MNCLPLFHKYGNWQRGEGFYKSYYCEGFKAMVMYRLCNRCNKMQVRKPR